MFKISEGQEKFEREFGTIDFFLSKLFFFSNFLYFFVFSNFELGSPKIEGDCGKIEFFNRRTTFYDFCTFLSFQKIFGECLEKLGESVEAPTK